MALTGSIGLLGGSHQYLGKALICGFQEREKKRTIRFIYC